MRRALSQLLPLLVVACVAAIVAAVSRVPVGEQPAAVRSAAAGDLEAAVARVDAWFTSRWREAGLEAAAPASDLQVLRRLSLALHGTIPSLEEIRQFESDTRADRLSAWIDRLLEDRRFSDYFAERLARSFVGKEEGQFVLFRRDRFTDWLRSQLRAGAPYDQMVRSMIAQKGLWTGKPEVNFVTAAIANEDIDRNKLTGRTARAFLGQRIDCAQCHDHPFAHWKQSDFEGLAAWYGQVDYTIVGVEDKLRRKDGRPAEFEVVDRKTTQRRVVAPAVPFHAEWLPEEGTRRQRLAAWVTHPRNRRFDRAIANRVWALMFGRAFHEPVDDLPDPDESAGATPGLLDLLANDFQNAGRDLRRLIRLIAHSAPFRAASGYEPLQAPDDEAAASLHARAQAAWALFPMARLRPEQVIGAMLQSSSVQTVDQNSHLLMRAVRFFQEGAFVREYGDLGDNELLDRGGTIPQRLLLLNGELARDAAKAGPFNASGRIGALASTDRKRVETAFLVCLTRLPTDAELAWFTRQFEGAAGSERQAVMEDLVWVLFNSTEFSWNH
jgi:hypothetical protein